MKNTTPHWIAIGVLLTILAAIGFKMIVLGNTAQGDDGRTAVVLEHAEKVAVLEEMRLLLETTQTIIEALAEGDLVAVENAATPVGSSAIATVDFALRAKLPLEFKQLGFGTHYAFDDIAALAKAGKPVKEIQLKLTENMNNCIACHAMYQLKTVSIK
ncbi:MAG: hypothetical protein R8M46_00800 [Ghiorsea sp.]